VKGKSNEIAVYRPRSTKKSQDTALASNSLHILGREHEISAIDRKFKSLTSDKPKSGIVIFEGSPGVGKSSLCRYIQSKAPSLLVEVLSGNGMDTECTTPYFAFRSPFLQIINMEREDFSAGEFEIAVKSCMKEELYDMISLFSGMYPDRISLSSELQERSASYRTDMFIHLCVSIIDFRVQYLKADLNNNTSPLGLLGSKTKQSKAASQLGIGMRLRRVSSARNTPKKASKMLGIEVADKSKEDELKDPTRLMMLIDDAHYMDAK
jgi:hypothetical protein